MLDVTLDLIDFMDSRVLPGCQLTFNAQVIAGWFFRPPRLDGDDEPELVIRFDETRAFDVSKSGITDSQGHLSLQLHLNSAYTHVGQLRHDGKPPDTIEARYSVDVEFHGLRLPANYKFDRGDSPDAVLPPVLVIADPARAIVGDTSATHTTLWFQLHSRGDYGRPFICELTEAGHPPRRQPVVFDARSATAVVKFDGLSPQTHYDFTLRLVDGDFEVARGSVKTFAVNPSKLTIALGSCHKPNAPHALDRWRALASREDIDIAFLCGDQIYGDDVDQMFIAPADADEYHKWLSLYSQRYTQEWQYQPMREALRSRPFYMALDDHDVDDDYGVVDIPADRVRAGLDAYRIFQQARNPGGIDAPTLDFSFKRGPAAWT